MATYPADRLKIMVQCVSSVFNQDVFSDSLRRLMQAWLSEPERIKDGAGIIPSSEFPVR
jgi:hypothetical protein